MDWIIYLKYNIINDFISYFYKLTKKAKINKYLIISMIFFIYIVFVFLMSLGIQMENMYFTFSCITLIWFCLKSLNHKIILFFNNSNNIKKIFIYSRESSHLYFLNILKFISLELIIFPILFLLIIASFITIGLEFQIILKFFISYMICFIFSISIYFFLAILKINLSSKKKLPKSYKIVCHIVLSSFFAYLIPYFISSSHSKNILTNIGAITLNLFKGLRTFLPITLVFKESVSFIVFSFVYILMSVLLILFVFKIIKLILNRYFLKLDIDIDITKITHYFFPLFIQKLNVLLRMELYKYVRNQAFVVDFIGGKIVSIIFVNILCISYYINIGILKNELLFYNGTLIFVLLMYFENSFAAYGLSSIESDRKFILHYIFSNYNIEKNINSKIVAEYIINSFTFVCCSFIPLILFTSNILNLLFILASALYLLYCLSVCNIYSTAIYPKYNWNLSTGIDKTFQSVLVTSIFNYGPVLLINISVFSNYLIQILRINSTKYSNIAIIATVMIIGSILTIKATKTIFRHIGRPYGEWQI